MNSTFDHRSSYSPQYDLSCSVIEMFFNPSRFFLTNLTNVDMSQTSIFSFRAVFFAIDEAPMIETTTPSGGLASCFDSLSITFDKRSMTFSSMGFDQCFTSPKRTRLELVSSKKYALKSLPPSRVFFEERLLNTFLLCHHQV